MVLTFHRKLLPAQVQDKTGNGTQVHSQLTLLGWLLQIEYETQLELLQADIVAEMNNLMQCNVCRRAIVNSNLTFV